MEAARDAAADREQRGVPGKETKVSAREATSSRGGIPGTTRAPTGLAAVALAGLAAVALAGLTPPARAAVRPAGHEAAFAAAAAGPAATSWNPANLALFPERRIELFGLQAGLGNDSYTLREYQRLNGASWDDGDKDALLAAIHSSAVTLSGRASLRATGISLGQFAVSTETRGASRAAMPKEALELLLHGNSVGKSFDLEGARAEGVAFSELRLSLAGLLRGIAPIAPRALEDWCAGASVKLLRGWGYGKLLEARGGVTTTVERLTGDGYLRHVSARGGNGFAFDLGLAGPLGGGWTAALAARDLGGRLKWTRRVEERTDRFDAPGIRLGDDDKVVVSESVTLPMSSLATSLPVLYSAGVARQGERFLAALHLEAASSRSMGASPALRGAVGAAWTCRRWLALRGNLSVGGEDVAAIGGGAGLAWGPVQLDLGVNSWGSVNPFASKGIGVGAALGIDL